MLHLAAKAFWPAPIPFGMLHVDTGHNFAEVLQFRDEAVEFYGASIKIVSVQDYIDDGRLRERPDGTRNPLQTVPLLDAITEGRHDAVFGGGRRDEERARAKERVFSMRDEFGQWEPQPAPRAVVALQRTPPARRACPGLSAFQLDGVGRVGLHRGREDQRADDLLRPRTPGGAARRHGSRSRTLRRRDPVR